MSTPLQSIWLIDPIEPPTEPVLVVREILDPLTDVIPIQRPHPASRAQARPTTRRSASPPSPPRRGYRNLTAVVLMLMLLLGATAVVSAFL